MKRMLINATQEEELRMAMVDGQRLFDLNIEAPASERKKANIYKGKITRIEPSLEAAFVNYGAERHGFLPLKEISSEYFIKDPGTGKLNIKDVLREGQDIVVQIDKEERGNKGAALTTFVSLAGRFIVLKPNKARSGGVSRRIVGDDRDAARKSLKNVEIPDGMSVILRTAGIDRTSEELAWDLENLMNVWKAILKVVVERPSPFLIYRESNAVVRALRDYLTNDIGEILIDDQATYSEAQEFVEQVMPHNLRKLKHYTDPVPLFTRYQIESQIESAFAHTVHLPSGGSLVIDHTEALVSIDINSARATKGGDIEATALNTNLEAADEIARQLRLRDLGGLIVIDFIDMGPQKNQREVESRLREAVKQDRARIQIGKISRFGLLEMSRQRLRPSLGESSYLTCPRCSGIGNIRSVESLALAILRIIGEEARKERTAKVIAQLPVEVATYLLNEKRDWVQNLETRNDTQVILVANELLETPHYRIRRVRDDQVELPENTGNSYTLIDPDQEELIPASLQERKPAEIAAVTTVVATSAAPARVAPPAPKSPGFLARLAAMFARTPNEEEKKPSRKKPVSAKRSKKKSSDKRAGGRRRSTGSKDTKESTRTRSKRPTKKRAKKKDRQKDEKAASRAGNGQPADANPEQRAQADGTDTTPAPRKKRRSRGGRRRRKSSDRSEAQSSSPTQQQKQSADTKGNGKADESTDKTQDKPATSAQAASAPAKDRPAKSTTHGGTGSDDAHRGDRPDSANEQAAKVGAPKSRDEVAVSKPAAVITTTATPLPDEKTAGSAAAMTGEPATFVEPTYEDTQPELPQLHDWKDNSETIVPSAKAETTPPLEKHDLAPKTTPLAEKSAAEHRPEETASVDRAKKSETKSGETQNEPATSAAPPEQSQGRLLPWEPQTESGKTSGEDEPTQP